MADLIFFSIPFFYIGIGVYALNKKTPMHFWSNQKVQSDEITDVKAYNRENGVSWIIYGTALFLCALLRLVVGDTLSAILFSIAVVFGIFWLIGRYGKIYKKYRK